MSLVNDMLRDLDQRRQDSNPASVGAERLIPVAAELEKKKSKFSLFTFAMSIAITLSLIMAFLYFRQASFVVPDTVEPAFTPNTVPTQAVSNPEPAQIIGVDPEEHALVAQRLQALEEENRALVAAQQAALQAQASKFEEELAAIELADAVAEQSAPAPTASNALSQASAAVDQVDAVVLNNSAQAAVSDAGVTADPSPVSSVVRSPRELSFSDQDLLQAQDAMRLIARNQPDQAIKSLQQFLGENPSAHQSRETLIKLALQSGDSAAAENLLNAGLAIAPSRDAFRKLQARLFLSAGKTQDALAILNTRIPNVSEDLEYHDLLATAYLSTQDYSNAAKTYEALVQHNRNEARWWYGLASSWDSLGRNRDAALAYEQAMNLPNLSATLRQRSQVRVAEIGN